MDDTALTVGEMWNARLALRARHDLLVGRLQDMDARRAKLINSYDLTGLRILDEDEKRTNEYLHEVNSARAKLAEMIYNEEED